nr:carcinoembryonic antigen-related cell adhesion molecule 20-like [Danio rerio]XP_021328632.1 carcinoembryonic antigen-related cell adhesion molecule 20-like [Danio rerio]|eukprot:XP_021322743.1 carcinoembryonic antigen-related cell adhesion molecule 20-like [Danio rerio]
MVSRGLLWTLWIVACFGQSFGQDFQLPELTNGAIGESVELTPNNLPSEIDTVTWQFGATFILSGNPDTASIVSAYKDKAGFDKNTLALELWNLKLEDAGSYVLFVLSSSGDQFRGETEPLIEGESSANITSKGDGPITSVQWMKDNSPLSSSRIIFSSDNRSVSISPVERSDTGEYQCTYSNPVSSETAKLTLIINYGPEGVSIKGPDMVDLGVQVFLSCTANSEPSASFSWTFNGSDTGVTRDTLTIDKTDFTHSGEYICTAINRVTNRRESQRHALLVQEGGEAGLGGGLPAGAIAGIVIGVLVAVGGICGLIVYFTKTNKIPTQRLQHKGQASGAAQRGQELDLHYEEITDSQRARENFNLENISEAQTYENVAYKSDYENLKHGVLKQPQASEP